MSDKNPYPGEFEVIVLATLVRLGDDAYGMRIRQDIEERTGRAVSIGQVYATLRRLEAKGHVATTMGEPSPERGGRAKRFFRLTAIGSAALERSRRMFLEVLSDLPDRTP
jgi:DNA-binding PadR family transcriptional regulator